MNEHIRFIQDWYKSQCDGFWEHSYGVTIDTLDNPGWKVKIDLYETDLEDFTFKKVEVERSENDWFHCKVTDNTFQGFGGPLNLEEILGIFYNFVESYKSKAG